MAGIGPNQYSSASYLVTAGSTVNTQITDLAAGTAGRINYIVVTFAGHAAIAVGNGMTAFILDAAASNQFFAARANRANANALDIPGVALVTLSGLNLPFNNGLSVQVASLNAGDSGSFSVMIGYDRTF
jgi:hypothetical protein